MLSCIVKFLIQGPLNIEETFSLYSESYLAISVVGLCLLYFQFHKNPMKIIKFEIYSEFSNSDCNKLELKSFQIIPQ